MTLRGMKLIAWCTGQAESVVTAWFRLVITNGERRKDLQKQAKDLQKQAQTGKGLLRYVLMQYNNYNYICIKTPTELVPVRHTAQP